MPSKTEVQQQQPLFIDTILNDKIPVTVLTGYLGSGKTTLIKLIIKHLGGNSFVVHSPSYNIVNLYKLYNITVNHFDLYKIRKEEDIYNIELFYDLNHLKNITIIEWGLIIKNMLNQYYEINFHFCKKKHLRSINIPIKLLW